MAREGSIEKPNQSHFIYAEKHGKNVVRSTPPKTGSSLSQLVTNLVENEVGDKIPVTVRLNRIWWEKASKEADKNGMTLEQFVQKHVAG
jgi:hypothetical protein